VIHCRQRRLSRRQPGDKRETVFDDGSSRRLSQYLKIKWVHNGHQNKQNVVVAIVEWTELDAVDATEAAEHGSDVVGSVLIEIAEGGGATLNVSGRR